MVYVTGVHPHIRSGDSVAGRYWTAFILLLPSVILKIMAAGQSLVLIPVLFFSAAVVHFASGFLQPARVKSAGWRQGILPLLAVLWFLILPAQTAFFPAVFCFAFALFFIYEFFRGAGAYPVHPLTAGLLFLHLFFPQENLNTFSGPGNFIIWNISNLFFLAFAGLYLGVQKKIRLLPALLFIALTLLSAVISARALDFELFYFALIFGFYFVTDSSVWPLKANLHLFAAAGAGIFMTGLILCGAEVLLAAAVSLSVCNLASQWFDSPDFLGLKTKGEVCG